MASSPRLQRISNATLRTPSATLSNQLLPRPLIDPLNLQPEIVYALPFGNAGVSNPVRTHQKVMAPAVARKKQGVLDQNTSSE